MSETNMLSIEFKFEEEPGQPESGGELEARIKELEKEDSRAEVAIDYLAEEVSNATDYYAEAKRRAEKAEERVKELEAPSKECPMCKRAVVMILADHSPTPTDFGRCRGSSRTIAETRALMEKEE